MTTTISSECRKCLGERTHIVLAQDRVERGESDRWWEVTESLFLRCAGCGETSLRKVSWDAATPAYAADVETFPPPASRPKPKWFFALPVNQQAIVGEIYRSLDADCPALAMMGTRTSVDLVIQDQIGDRNFADGLHALEEKSLLTHTEVTVLEAAIDAGHAAAHRNYRPSKDDLHAVLDIVEHLLSGLYVLNDVATRLRAKTPSRSRDGKEDKKP